MRAPGRAPVCRCTQERISQASYWRDVQTALIHRSRIERMKPEASLNAMDQDPEDVRAPSINSLCQRSPYPTLHPARA